MIRVRASILLIAAAAAFGQEPPSPPVFPSSAEVVFLDLVARDRDGRLVTDLALREIEVREDGKPCALSSLRRVQDGIERATSSPGNEPGPHSGAPPGLPAQAPSALPPSVPGLQSVVVLVFDQLALPAARPARDAALEFASRRFPPGTWFGVFKVGEGLQILQPFTEDRSLLPAAIEAATRGGDSPRDSPVRPGFTSATEEAFEAARQSMAGGGSFADRQFAGVIAGMLRLTDLARREQRGELTLHPLLAIARGLAEVRGRKTLVFVSEGLHVPPDLAEAFRATISQANRANVAIYALDARGLSVDSPFKEAKLALGLAATASQAQSGSGGVDPESVKAPETAIDAIRLNVQANLEALAESTGGFLVQNTNDLRSGLERIGADLRSYYELAYVPPNPIQDGRYRRIEVKVSRPGVRVRTRQGYYALPPGAPVVLPSELPLAVALDAKVPPRDFEHRGAALVLAGNGKATPSVAFLEVPLRSIRLRTDEAAGVYRGRVSVLALVRDEKEEMVARLSHDWDLEGPLGEAAAVAQGKLILKRSLSLPPGRYVLESAVLDRESQRTSVRRAAFLVPASTGLSLGDLALVKLQAASDADGGDDPLRVGDLRAVPTLGEPFPEGTPEVAVFWTAQAPPEGGPPAVELQLRKDGSLVGRAAPTLPAPDPRGRLVQVSRLATAKLPPGRYQVWALATQGSSEATAATSFEIVAGPRSAPAVESVPPSAPAPPLPADVADLLERAGAYVEEYQTEFKDLVAEESYRQWLGSGGAAEVRSLLSDLVFVTLPGDVPWTSYRDVFEVNGVKVRDRDARLERLFLAKQGDPFERANEILRESARFNLGPAYRTINVPTLALLFLHPRNQGRFQWERKGKAGKQGVELAFQETARPTLVHNGRGGDLPARGQFWIEPGRGVVLRSEVNFLFERTRALATLKVEYAKAPGLDILVPESMREFYVDSPYGPEPEFGQRIECIARYAKYRHFDVATSESVDLPEPPPP